MPEHNQEEYKRGWKDYSALGGGFNAALWQQSYSYRRGYRAAQGAASGRRIYA